MLLDQLKQQAGTPLLLVPDAAAASRFEAVWLGIGVDAGSLVAERPLISTPAGALGHLHERAPGAETFGNLLTPAQADVLWRQIVTDSPQGAGLIGAGSAAAAAGQAWLRLHEWGVPWQSLRAAPDDADFSALLDWCRAFDRRLRAENWLDAGALCTVLAAPGRETGTAPAREAGPASSGAPGTLSIGSVVATGLPPALNGALERSSPTGAVAEITPSAPPADPVLRVVRDEEAELVAFARWLEPRLAAGERGPFALIVPRSAARRATIETIVGDLCNAFESNGSIPLWFAGGDRLPEFAAPAAAFNALELVFGRGDFSQLGAWLRSAFFAADEPEEPCARGRAEAALRGELVTQRTFADAMRRAGLRERIAAYSTTTAHRLGASLEIADRAGALHLPTDWIGVWEAVLRSLGWQPTAFATARETLGAWDRALQAFSSLSPMLGRIPAIRALSEFRTVAGSLEVRTPMPLGGVHVFERPPQVGPGYAGIWLCGFTDRHWPASMRLSALLPARLQRVHGMPYATPEDAHRRSSAELGALLHCGREIVLSAPAEVDDAPARVSRLLGDVRPARVEAAPTRPGYARGRLGVRRLAERPDPVPAAGSTEVNGGTRLLELQANCPVRAFCEIRLGAKPLERIRRGVTPRVRGIALHRALEILFRPAAGRGPIRVAELRAGVTQSAVAALRDSIPWSDPPWDLIVELESARAERALHRLLDCESRRETIDVAAVEEPVAIVIDGYRLDGRLDRVDRLADGRRVIVDYKTGQAPSTAGWYSDRLSAPQLPAYAIARPDATAGFVVAAIGDDRVDFRAAGDLPDDYPARARPPLVRDAWSAQLLRWRESIGGLLAEFAAGDVRIDAANTVLADGQFAPLTRLFECIGEHAAADDDGD